MPNIKVFSGSSHPDLANKVVERLGSFSMAALDSVAKKPPEIINDLQERCLIVFSFPPRTGIELGKSVLKKFSNQETS